MYQQEHILNELQALSPIFASIPKRNIFSVPEGYFDMLPTQLVLQVRSAAMSHKALKTSTVPEGYFESLADKIMARIKQESMNEILVETHAISSLVADIGKRNVYQVPLGYFEALADNILMGLKQEAGAMAATEFSEVLETIGRKNVFSVPAGYFENLASEVSGKVDRPAKVVHMKSRFASFRYAAAAVVTALAGLSIFFILNKNTDPGSSVQTAAVMSEAQQIIQQKSFDKELSSVSDAAIVSFLESKGQDVEAALVASLVDDKELPGADEYIINENTLDELLKTIDLNN